MQGIYEIRGRNGRTVKRAVVRNLDIRLPGDAPVAPPRRRRAHRPFHIDLLLLSSAGRMLHGALRSSRARMAGLLAMAALGVTCSSNLPNPLGLTEGRAYAAVTSTAADAPVEEPVEVEPEYIAPEIHDRATPAQQLQAMQYLVDRHELPPLMAAAIIGNTMVESELDPTAINRCDRSLRGNARCRISYGIAQWNDGSAQTSRDDRLSRMYAFVDAAGAGRDDLFAQLDFIVHELNTTETTARDIMLNARTLGEANRGMVMYERPYGSNYGYEYAHSVRGRYDRGAAVLAMYEDDTDQTFARGTRPTQRHRTYDTPILVAVDAVPALEPLEPPRDEATFGVSSAISLDDELNTMLEGDQQEGPISLNVSEGGPVPVRPGDGVMYDIARADVGEAKPQTP